MCAPEGLRNPPQALAYAFNLERFLSPPEQLCVSGCELCFFLSLFLTLQLGILGLQVSAVERLPPVFLITKVTNKEELGNLLCSWAWA